MLSLDEVSRRRGVELVEAAGFDRRWSIPVSLWDAPHGFDTRSDPDEHSCHVIALRLKGALVQRVDPTLKMQETLRPNGFSVHPPECKLRFWSEHSIQFAHLYVTDDLLKSVKSDIFSNAPEDEDIRRPPSVMYVDNKLTVSIRDYVLRAFSHKDRPTRLEMESRATLIVLRLLQKHWHRERLSGTRKDRMPSWQVRKVCNFLDQNLDRVVALDELSDLLNLSKEHICRAFQSATGMPPLRWHLNRRIEVACLLLMRKEMTLTEIAQQLGYAGQSAFGAQFKKVTGMSPRRYRNGL